MSAIFFRRVALRVLSRWPARRPTRAGAGGGKVCFFKPDRIGDFVLALGAMRQLAAAHEEERCEFVVAAAVAELARAEFPRATVFALPPLRPRRHLLRVAASWRQWRPVLAGLEADTVICLRHHRSVEEECALLWLGAGRVIGLENSGHEISAAHQAALPGTLTEAVPRPLAASPSLCLELECHRQLLRRALRRETTDQEILPRLTSVRPESGDTLLLAPFSSSWLKDYPAARLLEALARALPRLPGPLALTGSAEQLPRLETLRGMVHRRCGVDAQIQAGATLDTFIAAVARARAVLTVDTAAAHIATALDKPTVILHNGTRYGEFGPWHRSARQRWLVVRLDCFGCGGRCSRPTPSCVQDLDPASVADELVAVAAKGWSRPFPSAGSATGRSATWLGTGAGTDG